MSTQQLPISDAMANSVETAAQKAALLSALGAIARKVRTYLAEYIRRRAIRRVEQQLMALDDRSLRDIGLTRSEIHSAVRSTEQRCFAKPA